jgi:DNA end-binding protein Ku
MARAVWSGSISFGLVNVPVQMFAATRPKDISFSLLRKSDHSHIQYKKVSAADGKEVPAHEIVKGYEIEPDKFVTLSEEELASLQPERSKMIAIEKFVDTKALECLYFDKTYFLGPEKNAEKAYALLNEAMKETKKAAIAKIVLNQKEHIVALRPQNNTISLYTLYYADEVSSPDEVENLPDKKAMPGKKEMAIATQLINAISGPFELSDYRDERREKIVELAEKKAAGKAIETTAPVKKAAKNVVDLMGALKASLAASQKSPRSKAKPTPKKRAERKSA